VPGLADWCALDVLDEAGHVDRFAAAHVRPRNRRLLRPRGRRRSGDAPFPSCIAKVLRTREAIFFPVVGEAEARAIGGGDAEIELLRAIGLRSFACVPLVADGQVLGALTLGIGEDRAAHEGALVPPGAGFGEAERALVLDLASLFALAIDRGRLFHKAQAAAVARQEFLLIASHELKTPMVALGLYYEALKRAIDVRTGASTIDERLRELLASGSDQVEHMLRLIGRLLDVSRAASGQLDIHREPFDVVRLVGEVIARLSAGAPKAPIRLDAPDPVTGSWDRLRLEQVFTNLISNAIKYGENKPIEVEVRADGDTARIIVRDRGIGIAPESLPRIFERFERSAPREYGGFGLGLYIARAIATAHGGTIRAASERGKGSTFTVELPRAPAEGDAGR
jgi:signal transduction histidine kinase